MLKSNWFSEDRSLFKARGDLSSQFVFSLLRSWAVSLSRWFYFDFYFDFLPQHSQKEVTVWFSLPHEFSEKKKKWFDLITNVLYMGRVPQTKTKKIQSILYSLIFRDLAHPFWRWTQHSATLRFWSPIIRKSNHRPTNRTKGTENKKGELVLLEAHSQSNAANRQSFFLHCLALKSRLSVAAALTIACCGSVLYW